MQLAYPKSSEQNRTRVNENKGRNVAQSVKPGEMFVFPLLFTGRMSVKNIFIEYVII
jgi:hypothetical protein